MFVQFRDARRCIHFSCTKLWQGNHPMPRRSPRFVKLLRSRFVFGIVSIPVMRMRSTWYDLLLPPRSSSGLLSALKYQCNKNRDVASWMYLLKQWQSKQTNDLWELQCVPSAYVNLSGLIWCENGGDGELMWGRAHSNAVIRRAGMCALASHPGGEKKEK